MPTSIPGPIGDPPADDPYQCVKDYDVFTTRLNSYANFKITPKCIYVIYVYKDHGVDACKEFFYFDGDADDPEEWKSLGSDSDIEDIIKELGNAARQFPTVSRYLLSRDDIQNLKFRHLSYLAILVDVKKFVFLDGYGSGAIEFIPYENKPCPNHTFFDARTVSIGLNKVGGGSGTDPVSTIIMINHLKADDFGTPLASSDKQNFKFEMHSPEPGLVGIDPGGTNMGPSAPPP